MNDVVNVLATHYDETKRFYDRLASTMKNRDELYSVSQKGSLLPGGMKFIGKEAKLCKKIRTRLQQQQQ